jgi:hypothetical protein
MAPHKKATAPANRVYKSSVPLKQLKFPEPKKRVTYGKQTSKRIPEANQDTLTQMDFVKLAQLNDEDDEDLDRYEDVAEKRQKKRRKTLGDQPSSNSKFHTQTLTQINSWSPTAAEEQGDDGVFDVPSSPRSRGLRKNIPTLSGMGKPTTQSTSRRQSAPGKMGPPQTPRKMITREIPSSQSPETPLSSHVRTSPIRRSPLKEKSTNTSIPFPLGPKAVSTLYSSPKLKIQDTFDSTPSQPSHTPTSPFKRSSPAKTVRFDVPDDTPKDVADLPAVKKDHSQAAPSQKTSSRANSKLEILDSEAESDSDGPDDGYILPQEQSEDEQHETFYGNIGAETQMEIEGLLIPPHVEGSQILDEQQKDEELEQETQFMESQRLSTQHVDSMAPRTGDSDVFVSIHPQHVTSILAQTKDYEFRQWRLPPSVSRIWIYETAPTRTLKYMAVIGEKDLNDIRNGDGMGIAESNAKPSHSSNHAYEILGLYELADPLPWTQLYANEWLKSPPSKWTWVRPAVLDSLMANLIPPLFIRSALSQGIPSSSPMDAEEAEAQLLSTMLQFTETATHSQPSTAQTIRERGVSCEEPSLPTTRRETPDDPHPSQASTASFSESQTPGSQTLAEVVWESPTRPIPSSTPLQLELPTPIEQDNGHGSGSIVPYSLSSSQLLTKSQMLPASLLSDSVPGPPLSIQDSDEEED